MEADSGTLKGFQRSIAGGGYNVGSTLRLADMPFLQSGVIMLRFVGILATIPLRRFACSLSDLPPSSKNLHRFGRKRMFGNTSELEE